MDSKIVIIGISFILPYNKVDIISLNYMKKTIIVDGNHLIHRSFWGIPPLNSSDGTPSNAIFGFFSTLLHLLYFQKPDYLIFTFDTPEPTFRHKEYSAYKALRKPAPDELKLQIPLIYKLLKLVDIVTYSLVGVESDDLIATLSKMISVDSDNMVFVLSGDMDLCQLISDRVHILRPQNGGKIMELDEKLFFGKYEIRPDQVIDFKALAGDPSDNIKGVKGIGKKTAVNLLTDYQDLDNVYVNIDQIKSKSVQNKLIIDRESAFHSRYLVELKNDCDISLDLSKASIEKINYDLMMQEFKRYEFYILIKRLERYLNMSNGGEMANMINDVFNQKPTIKKVPVDQLQMF